MGDMRALLAALQRTMRRAVGMLARGVLRAAVDAPGIQEMGVDLLADEGKAGLQRLQDYGFTAVPLPGGELLVGFLGGDRAHGVVLRCDDRRYRKRLQPGDSAQYDFRGQFVKLGPAGVEIVGDNVLIRTPGVLRLDGGRVELRGETSLQTEVHGKGERRSHLGGADYRRDSYQDGAVETAEEHGLDQPDLPSDHPLGPA